MRQNLSDIHVIGNRLVELKSSKTKNKNQPITQLFDELSAFDAEILNQSDWENNLMSAGTNKPSDVDLIRANETTDIFRVLDKALKK